MDYAHVTDTTVDQIGLPDTYRRSDGSTVSGYQHSNPADLAADGWLSVVEDRPELAEGEQYGQPTYAVADGQVTATYPIVAVALEPVTVDPLALLAAEQAAIIESLLAALDTANVIDAAQVKADSKAGQADNDLLIRIAKAFGMSVDEVVKVRDTDPKRWAELTAKFDGEGK